MNDTDKTDCALLVSSFDGGSDLWAPYFNLLKKNWPDCPFPIFLITEAKRPNIENVTPLTLGRGLDWSSLLLKALDQIKATYILFMLEDFFLRKPVDTKRVLVLLDEMKNESLNMMRLTPRTGPNEILRGKEYGEIKRGTAFRVSAQAAFWRVQAIKDLLVMGENAWQFEVCGSMRSNHVPGFVCVWKDALTYGHHVVEQGKWFPWEFYRFRKMNIGIDPKARSVMTLGESLNWAVRKAFSPFYQKLKKFKIVQHLYSKS